MQLLCMFTLKWKKEGSKEFQFRTETEAECQTWVHAISKARYSSLLNDKEQLEQKYLHLSQIVESESTAKWQYSRQCEELSAEIEKLRREINTLKRQESRANNLRLVLAKSAALVDTLVRSQVSQAAGAPSPSPSASSPSGNEPPPPGEASRTRRAGGFGPIGRSVSSCTARGLGLGLGSRTRPAPPAAESAKQQDAVAAAASRARSADLAAAAASRPATPVEMATSSASGRQQASGGASSPRTKSDFELDSAGRFKKPSSPATSALVNSASQALQRTRSMEQEQAEQERAVRRARRCSQAGQVASIAAAAVSQQASAASVRVATHQRRLRQLASSFDIGFSGRRSLSPLAAKPSAVAAAAASTTPLGSALLPLDGGGVGQHNQDNLVELYQQQLARAQALRSLIKTADEKTLSRELQSVVEALNKDLLLSDCILEVESSEELRKIRKVQSFFRGWLCRRRWKQIVQEYIKSPHAESMRKRNNLVFKMVECEEEYVEQLALLIAAFLRPLKMAASSQRPALDHDELNSIFLNSETLLFLHQIFLKGLTARMESWPTLVLGDLFNMLLPMLTIYQEYVRNHHFSLQVLAECKQREAFSLILRRLEEKPQLGGRTLETFLTYPMHQIPRYIICLHEILAHTPHNHVERKSLYEAQTKLEELSRQMHDEVSETENIRQNLAIERMIIGGCDLLLDINQVFVRQGILLQVVEREPGDKKSAKSRLSSLGLHRAAPADGGGDESNYKPTGLFANYFSSAPSTGSGSGGGGGGGGHGEQTKELIRQCFLFTNHLLLCTRTKDGKLRLLDVSFASSLLLAVVTLRAKLATAKQLMPIPFNNNDNQLEPSKPNNKTTRLRAANWQNLVGRGDAN